MGVLRDNSPAPLGGKGFHFNNNDCDPNGGDDVLSSSPISYKFISAACLHAAAKQQSDEASEVSHDGSHPAMP